MARKHKQRENGGRPPIPIDWHRVNQYLQAGCTGSSIARFMNIHPETLYDRCVAEFGEVYGITHFSEYSKIKKGEGDDLLKVSQFQKAVGGDTTMQIWLGKNRLGQKDRGELDIGLPPEIKIVVTSEDNKAKLDNFLNDGEPK